MSRTDYDYLNSNLLVGRNRQTVLTGADLQRFKAHVSQALSGDLGEIDRVEVTMTDAGQIVLAANGYMSEPMGQSSEFGRRVDELTFINDENGSAPTGSVNYRSLAQTIEQRAQTLERRVVELERIAERAKAAGLIS